MRSRAVYACDARQALKLLSFPASRYFEESFGAASPETGLAPAENDACNVDAVKHRLVFEKSGKVIDCGAAETILEAAGRQGLSIASACRMGFCGSCRIRKREGDVQIDHSGGINEADIADGYILACCSYARSDMVIEG